MKITIDRKTLTKHINIVQKAISNRTTLQILEGILFIAKDNKLTLISTDTELSIKTSLSAIVSEEGSIVVNSKLFGNIIRKFNDDTIYINLNNLSMNIICGNSEFNIQTQLPNEYPDLPKINNENEIIMDGNRFKEAIKKTVFATSMDETRMTYTGIFLNINKDKITFVALDGFRMAFKTVNIKSNIEKNLIISSRSANELIKILDENEELKINIDANEIVFYFGDTIFYSVLLSGEFFDYNSLIQNNYKIISKVKRTDLLNSLERASLLVREDRANLVKFHITENNIIITSNSEIGNVHETLNAKTEGENIEIAFNSKYLIDGLKIMESEEVNLNLIDSINPCIIKEEDDKNYIYLVLPVRLAN